LFIITAVKATKPGFALIAAKRLIKKTKITHSLLV